MECQMTKRALGIKIKCHCGNETFTFHTIGKQGYMVACIECGNRYEITETRDDKSKANRT